MTFEYKWDVSKFGSIVSQLYVLTDERDGKRVEFNKRETYEQTIFFNQVYSMYHEMGMELARMSAYIESGQLADVHKKINYLVDIIENRRQVRGKKEHKKIGKKVREFIFKRDGLVCKNCTKEYPREFLHIDHIKPSSRGGETAPWNLQVLCRDCNLIKRNHIFITQREPVI